MTYYSLTDDQNSGALMHIGRNSKTLDELFESKLDYHSDLEDQMEHGKTLRDMYNNTIEGKVEACFDFEFTIVKHEVEFSENAYEELSEKEKEQNAEAFDTMTSLTYEEAVKEFCCLACANESILETMADEFQSADRRACSGESSETTDPDKFEVMEKYEKLCKKHKEEFKEFDL